MSLLVDANSKEQQAINELQRKLNAKLERQGKDETRQKILLGAFLLDLLEQDKVSGLRQYTVDNLDKFLSRDGDKTLLLPVVNNVRKLLGQKVVIPSSDKTAQVVSSNSQEVTHANDRI